MNRGHTAAELSGTDSQPIEDSASELARHRDPSLISQAGKNRVRPRAGVTWVRASELLTVTGGRITGRGIDFHAELARRARRLPVQAAATSRQAIRGRANRLPPVTDFGRRTGAPHATARSGLGLR